MPVASLEVRPTSVAEMQDHAQALIRANWDESRQSSVLGQLSIHWDQYYALERLGKLILLGAWRGDEMVGYSVAIIAPHSQSKGCTIAQSDTLYVSPSVRGSRLWLELMKATEHHAQLMGARVIVWAAKPGTPLDTYLQHSATYFPQETHYTGLL